MQSYLALLRGINVGGRNKVPMALLKETFTALGCLDVQTYIQSGNVVFRAAEPAAELEHALETAIPRQFRLDSDSIMVLVVPADRLAAIVHDAPSGFGSAPGKYNYDVAFLKGVTSAEAEPHFQVNPEVDAVWFADGVVYYRRLTSARTRSRIRSVIASPIYPNITIRNWNTTTRLLALVTPH
ncbi:MAG: DUF1697 domain-containing protein [Mycobacteriaceae bacterium]|nr:DUF1697 domain-containing protein [Mycobacteriaceae bacterium]